MVSRVRPKPWEELLVLVPPPRCPPLELGERLLVSPSNQMSQNDSMQKSIKDAFLLCSSVFSLQKLLDLLVYWSLEKLLDLLVYWSLEKLLDLLVYWSLEKLLDLLVYWSLEKLLDLLVYWSLEKLLDLLVTSLYRSF